MSHWQVHVPSKDNRIDRYQCGFVAGQTVALQRDLVERDFEGKPTGVVHPKGERWQVLPGVSTDPVLFLLSPDGNLHTWDDDASATEWLQEVH